MINETFNTNFFEEYCLEENILTDPKKIIFQDLYSIDLFENFIQLIHTELFNNIKSFIQINTNQMLQLLPSYWTGRRFFKHKKTIIIAVYQRYDQITNKEDLKRIEQGMFKSNGCFLSNLKSFDRNVSIMFLKEQQNFQQQKQTIIHELIHIFQWFTGRSIHSNYDEQIVINKQDEIFIKSIFHIKSSIDLKDILDNLFNQYQLINYAQQIFYDIKNNFENVLIRHLITNMFNELKKKQFNSFKDFYENIDNIVLDELQPKFKLMLMLSAYFRIGFNTLKNHIFGYLNEKNS